MCAGLVFLVTAQCRSGGILQALLTGICWQVLIKGKIPHGKPVLAENCVVRLMVSMEMDWTLIDLPQPCVCVYLCV